MKPPIAKLANVFGRLEAYSFSVLIFVLGYVQEAASQNIKTFASAQIFYATGSTGVQYLQQLFIADTTDLRNRALFSSIVDTPFLATVWLGPIIANKILHETTFRWGYGIWAIVLPVCFLPLALSLFINMHKAKKLGFIRKSPLRDMSTLQILKYMWYELDFFGLLLLSAAISLILLPLTLAQMARGKWANPSMIAMLVVGGICLIAFPLWERSKKLAPQAFFPRELFRERTVCAGVALAFFYFSKHSGGSRTNHILTKATVVYYLSVQPYFYSYLLVVQNMSVTSAGHVTQVFSFTSSVTAVIAGLIAKYTGHYKWFMTLGTCIYLLGIGLMIKYRTETASVGALVGCQIVVGIGGGLTNVLAQLGVQASVSHQGVASATAVFLTTLEIGGAVGSAISGSIWSSSIPARLERYLPENAKMEAASIYGSVLVASERYPPGTPERAAINRAYQETMTNLLTVAVCVCVPVIICSLFMKNYDLRKVSQWQVRPTQQILMKRLQIDQKVKGRVIGGQDTSDGLPESLNQSSVRCED